MKSRFAAFAGTVRLFVGCFARAVSAWAQTERAEHRLREVFRAVTPTRKDCKRVDNLARRLLVWHIERGHTLKTIETMIDAPNTALCDLPH